MRSSIPLEGILVALVTPLTSDGSQIDEDLLHAHIDRLARAGVHGIVAAGSTGEFTTLTLSERKRLAELCVEYSAGRISVTIGTGSNSTAEAVELTKHAHDIGADAVMVVPPFYEPMTPAELHRYLKAVAESADIPIVYYNIPGASGVNLTPAELAELAQVAGIKYLKDTSGDAVALGALLEAHKATVTAFNGWDTLSFFGLASGAKGAVWGAVNFIPELAMDLWNTVSVRGDLKGGRDLWSRIWPICAFLEAHNYVASVKTALDLVGHTAGPTRQPILTLPDADRAELKSLLDAAGVSTIA